MRRNQKESHFFSCFSNTDFLRIHDTLFNPSGRYLIRGRFCRLRKTNCIFGYRVYVDSMGIMK